MASTQEWLYLGMEQADEHFAELARLQQAQLDTLQQLQAAQQQAEYISQMRGMIFNLSRQAENLEQHASSRPRNVYLMARRSLMVNRVLPQSFPEFKDKEYTQRVLDRLNRIVQQCRTQLTAEENAQCERFFQYDQEMTLLEAAIGVQAARENLPKAEAEWKSAARKRGLLHTGRILSRVFGGIIGSISLLSFCVTMIPTIIGSSHLSIWLPLLGLAISGGLFVAGGVFANRYEQANRKWSMAEYEYRGKCDRVNRADWKQIEARFGLRSSDGYQQLRSDRQKYMNSLLLGVI